MRVPFLFIFLFVSILAVSLGVNGILLFREYQEQVVVSVPDGDSIQLSDGRRIRLLGLDAPEKGRCGAEEARDRLVTLVKDAHVALSDIETDDYGRQLALVTERGIFVNEVMIREGYARYNSVGGSEKERLKAASQKAQEGKLGIYASACRSLVPVNDCEIKGNNKNGQKTYHLPTCPNYSQTIVDLSFGDQWFCTEQEAKEAEFKKAQGCR